MLVALPLAGLGVYCAALVWQTWLGPRVRDMIERQQARAKEGRRWDRHRADGGVLGDLANSRLRAGDELVGVTARRPPDKQYQFGPFTEAFYDLGGDAWVSVIARDGHLVEAVWMQEPGKRQQPRQFVQDKFFEMSPTDRTDWQAALTAWMAARQNAGMAAAGPPAYIAFHDPLSLTRRP